MGISGRIARHFLHSQMTPLLALVAVLLGLFAVLVTPREEEPQINVTMANVLIAYPGASAQDVAKTVATPAEQVLSQIAGVDHVYSVAQPGMAVITVQFKVGEAHVPSLVKLYDVVHSHSDWLPQTLGVSQPIIKAKGIDDVPIVALTLWRNQQIGGGLELTQVAHAIEAELKRVPGTREVSTLGGTQRQVRVLLNPESLNAYQLSMQDVRAALQSANVSENAGTLVQDNREVLVQTGSFLTDANEVRQLVVGVSNNKPVFLRDVADVQDGADQPGSYVWLGTGPAADDKGIKARGEFTAVTVAISKKPGANAVEVADGLLARVAELKGSVIPADVEVSTTRNYGETANDKAMKLIKKLLFATAAVVALVWLAMGRREAMVVGGAVLLTLAATLFASWAWGFTLNRVSLFALIFSIGILVDDAIVVVENIHRHRALTPDQPLSQIIPAAVDEVGSPTILATFTVIAALLPMAFVSGLMGPYMSPIPINASMGMLISLAVAFVITPWLVLRFAGSHHESVKEDGESAISGFFHRVLSPFLNGAQGKPARRKLWLGILAGLVLAVSLGVVKLVILKMLPFDNKSEFQVVVDMPTGTALEQTNAVLHDIGAYLATVPEVTDYEAYAGAASPINFNGLVRQYYLRSGADQGDIQVNLREKHHRSRSSHQIATAMLDPIQKIAANWGAKVKIVEVPPGPPVMSPIVAEIYGPDYEGARRVASQVRAQFGKTEGIVGIDDTVTEAAPKLQLRVLQSKAALLGVAPRDIVDVIGTALSGQDVASLHDASAKYAPPLRIGLPGELRSSIEEVLKLKVRARDGVLVPISEVVQVIPVARDYPIYHKDLLPVVYVFGDMAGKLDSPLYGMFGINGQISGTPLAQGGSLKSYFFNTPSDPYAGYALKWDGEWQVTFETFRDMGIAYGVGLILIYLLVVAQFKSYLVPLIIMAPIPLTIIGVMPGHALLGSQYTATSMIGMIALAGIIVRNSILLVDFVNLQLAGGIPLQQAVIAAAGARAKPIVLTGLAAMLGAFFILDDPIFNGLAISLIFGILVSTLLTLVVIPVLYYATLYKKFQ
ncbi:efflux RND transporter permease subunit [Gallionella capsiferriformans]|uniref:Acriflavin resistance protein n=1 Tax=Gallionella capsiferriformans (strain ES-2) TaxID=395494 RepID=D9SIY6_GALCS|nr:efflux RND transporter permease subunit [Gallionella capsiferriformans]ADL54262.1 acriflavin resistance protein [Gallionella capsiferriformans ES-2]